jgi:hypothetical protein
MPGSHQTMPGVARRALATFRNLSFCESNALPTQSFASLNFV